MGDMLAFLQERSEEQRLEDPEKIAISFISTDLFSSRTLEKSLLSIDNIGDEIGKRFEIIVAVKENNGYDRILYSDLERKVETASLVRVKINNSGMAKRVVTNLASGEFFVFFDSSHLYDIDFADLISSFMRSKEKAVLLSDLMVMHRDIFIRAGGYRELSIAEDIDLLARLYESTNIIAFPLTTTNLVLNQARLLLTQKRSLKSLMAKSGLKIGQAQLHQILACNYSGTDLLLLSSARGKNSLISRMRISLYMLRCRFSRTRPIRYAQNNFILLMDKILESLILKDFERIHGFTMKPMLIMTKEEKGYLTDSSGAWKSGNIDNLISIEASEK